jgi:hypothetical protein
VRARQVCPTTKVVNSWKSATCSRGLGAAPAILPGGESGTPCLDEVAGGAGALAVSVELSLDRIAIELPDNLFMWLSGVASSNNYNHNFMQPDAKPVAS